MAGDGTVPADPWHLAFPSKRLSRGDVALCRVVQPRVDGHIKVENEPVRSGRVDGIGLTRLVVLDAALRWAPARVGFVGETVCLWRTSHPRATCLGAPGSVGILSQRNGSTRGIYGQGTVSRPRCVLIRDPLPAEADKCLIPLQRTCVYRARGSLTPNNLSY